MVEDMFLLARADAGQRQIVASDFYFDEMVVECVRSAQVLADAPASDDRQRLADRPVVHG